MRPAFKGALVAIAILAVLGALGGLMFVKATGLSARGEPLPGEAAVARRIRALAVPSEYGRLANPVLMNEESMRNGMAHFADHCAFCHANDGKGSEIGKSMFPAAPDMTRPTTQSLGDGELFYVIEHGIRFTGMPAFGTGTPAGEEASWHLVNFVRHVPELTPEQLEEMAGMNPRPPAEIRQEIEAERFLSGEGPAPAPAAAPQGH